MSVLDDGSPLAAYYEEACKQVGEVTSRSLGVLDQLMVQRYALTIGSTDELSLDPEAAREAGLSGVVAPPNMLSAIFEWGIGTPEPNLNSDGTPPQVLGRHGLRGMGAGEEIENLAPAIAGVELHVDESIHSVQAKRGRSGPCVFQTTEHVFRDGDGRVLSRNRRTVALQDPHEEHS